MNLFSDKINDAIYYGRYFTFILKKKLKCIGGNKWYGFVNAREIKYITECWKCEACEPEHIEWANSRTNDSTCRNFYFIVEDPVKIKLVKNKS
jgi:hypothetical protein